MVIQERHAASTRRVNFGNKETSFDKDRIGSIIGGKRRYMISRATADRRVAPRKFACRNTYGKMPLLHYGDDEAGIAVRCDSLEDCSNRGNESGRNSTFIVS
jgi:hypothetical protein